MYKTDNRIYNRKQNRDLAIEMDLYCLLKGKLLEAKGCFFDNKPVYGIIEDVFYEVFRGANLCTLKLDNGTEYKLRIKRGMVVKDDKILII